MLVFVSNAETELPLHLILLHITEPRVHPSIVCGVVVVARQEHQ